MALRTSRAGRALLVLLLVATALVVGRAPAQAAPAGLRLVGMQRLSSRLTELTFRTPTLTADTHVRVLYPAHYDPSGRTRYPVLYLLHGGAGSYRDWTDTGDAAALSAPYPMLVVMPDGGGFGNYVDWYNDGAGGPPMWETYHIGQLLPWVDTHLPTVGTRAGRAVAGLSMGGGGAMGYATRHPDLFAGAAAFSGAVDTNNLYVQPLVVLAGLQELKPGASVGGLRLTDEVRWRGRNAWDLAGNLRGLFLQLDTGNGFPGGPSGTPGDPIEYAVHEEMVSFHQRLAELGLPHVWDDYGPGGHEWHYWRRDLQQLLPRLADLFAHPQPAPSRVTFTSIDPTYSVYGWSVRIDRPAVEFSTLEGAAADGFVVRGSGRTTVTTAPLYRPGQALRVVVSTATGRRASMATADSGGRLRVVVPLGPGNPYQQYSPQGTVWQISRALFGYPGHLGDAAGTWPTATGTVAISPA